MRKPLIHWYSQHTYLSAYTYDTASIHTYQHIPMIQPAYIPISIYLWYSQHTYLSAYTYEIAIQLTEGHGRIFVNMDFDLNPPPHKCTMSVKLLHSSTDVMTLETLVGSGTSWDSSEMGRYNRKGVKRHSHKKSISWKKKTTQHGPTCKQCIHAGNRRDYQDHR